MDHIKTVGIRELKNNLSSYIGEVKRGWRVLVTDRSQIVAELREPLSPALEAGEHPVLIHWIREGKVKPPQRSKVGLSSSPCRFPSGKALSLLNEDRGE